MNNQISKKKNAKFSKNETLLPLLLRMPWIKKLNDHRDFGEGWVKKAIEHVNVEHIVELLVSETNTQLEHMPDGQGYDYSDKSDHKLIEISEASQFNIAIGSNSNVTKIGALRLTFADTTNRKLFWAYLPFNVWCDNSLTHKSTEKFHLRGYYNAGGSQLYLYTVDKRQFDLNQHLCKSFDEMCYKMAVT